MLLLQCSEYMWYWFQVGSHDPLGRFTQYLLDVLRGGRNFSVLYLGQLNNNVGCPTACLFFLQRCNSAGLGKRIDAFSLFLVSWNQFNVVGYRCVGFTCRYTSHSAQLSKVLASMCSPRGSGWLRQLNKYLLLPHGQLQPAVATLTRVSSRLYQWLLAPGPCFLLLLFPSLPTTLIPFWLHCHSLPHCPGYVCRHTCQEQYSCRSEAMEGKRAPCHRTSSLSQVPCFSSFKDCPPGDCIRKLSFPSPFMHNISCSLLFLACPCLIIQRLGPFPPSHTL